MIWRPKYCELGPHPQSEMDGLRGTVHTPGTFLANGGGTDTISKASNRRTGFIEFQLPNCSTRVCRKFPRFKRYVSER